MNLVWMSDIHLDHLDDARLTVFLDRVRVECSSPDSILMCTGDISVASRLVEHLDDVRDACAGKFCFVLGNHCVWGSSFARVRADVKSLVSSVGSQLVFMDDADRVVIDSDTCIVGDSGWYDARHGTEISRPRFIMNDWHHIVEYRGEPDVALASQRFADARAAVLSSKMESAAAAGFSKIIVLMHVPPYVDACRYRGKPSDSYALPWFTSMVVGNLLDKFNADHPAVRVEVLCGHTHDRYVYRRRANLIVHVAAADYGHPTVDKWKPMSW